METLDFNKLLLKTAFSCMACDGDIDKKEVLLIKKIHEENKIFGEIDINQELDKLILEINQDNHKFLRNYFNELTSTKMSEQNELKLIEVAIETIKADEKVEYSEIKFFKVIRSKLNIDNDTIIEKHSDFEEYLEEDIISESYLSKLQDEYFGLHNLPNFELNSLIDVDIIKNTNNDDK